jgi:hypothetical protein
MDDHCSVQSAQWAYLEFKKTLTKVWFTLVKRRLLMTTMTLNTAASNYETPVKTRQKQPLIMRFFAAIAESRRHKAQIETRRVLAMLQSDTNAFDQALLPFQGE